MPLKPGAPVSDTIKELYHHGSRPRSMKQIVAIALENHRRANGGAVPRYAVGGPMPGMAAPTMMPQGMPQGPWQGQGNPQGNPQWGGGGMQGQRPQFSPQQIQEWLQSHPMPQMGQRPQWQGGLPSQPSQMGGMPMSGPPQMGQMQPFARGGVPHYDSGGTAYPSTPTANPMIAQVAGINPIALQMALLAMQNQQSNPSKTQAQQQSQSQPNTTTISVAKGGRIPHYDFGGALDIPEPSLLDNAALGVTPQSINAELPEAQKALSSSAGPNKGALSAGLNMFEKASEPPQVKMLNSPYAIHGTGNPHSSSPPPIPSGPPAIGTQPVQQMAGGGMPPFMKPHLSFKIPHGLARMSAPVPVRHGLLPGTGGGRTDNLGVSVPHGSHIIPADVVSGLGQGNSLSGAANLDRAMRSLPTMSTGGTPHVTPVDTANHTPILAASGEYVVSPEHVRAVGGGDQQKGHSVLDKMILRVRRHTARTLKKLPPPKK